MAILSTAGCVSVPLDTEKTMSVAIEDTATTREARKAAAWLGDRTDINGVYPLTQGLDAFGVRLALMDIAEVSIDAQYFLMKPDNAGLVFVEQLLKAADRGIRVRLLLDDIFTTVDDVYLAAVNDHPNAEVRIFNPIARKGIYAFNYLGNFSRANRRMHNKSFVIDNQVAIVGGRNIAAEYFQLESGGEFIDFDMFTAGPIVKDVSAEFDLYWNHQLAIPMEALYQQKDPAKIRKAREEMNDAMANAGESIYGDAINTPLMKQIYAGEIPPYFAAEQLFADEPDKLLNKISVDQQLAAKAILQALDEAKSEIYVFTPYLIPRKSGIEFVKQLRAKGIRIVIVTNSLATNNHTSAFASYKKYRKDLLQAGVELWEARADAAKVTNPDGSTELEQLTLHTKGVLIDRERIFAGSLNFDPRSVDINTEMGLLIDSPELARRLADETDRSIPNMAYRVQLDDAGKVTWHATIDGEEVVETQEPQTTAWRRFQAWFLKIAPENQL